MDKLVDMKESLSNSRKPDITHVRGVFMTYTARPCEYGGFKGYERANYQRPVSTDPTRPTAADFNRLRAYLRAAVSHCVHVLDRMEAHQANDPCLSDIVGMQAAAYAVDIDTPGTVFGPSRLPHIAHACASLMMAIVQAVNAGLLPEDPGTPWLDGDV